MRVLISVLLGTLVGIFLERGLTKHPVISCPAVPNFPTIPECPKCDIDQINLPSCLKSLDSTLNKKDEIVKQKDDCTSALYSCNAESRFWQEKYTDCY